MQLRGHGKELQDMVRATADSAEVLSNEKTYVANIQWATVCKGLTRTQFQTLIRKVAESFALFKKDQDFVIEVALTVEGPVVHDLWTEKIGEVFEAKKKAADLLLPDKKLVTPTRDKMEESTITAPSSEETKVG